MHKNVTIILYIKNKFKNNDNTHTHTHIMSYDMMITQTVHTYITQQFLELKTLVCITTYTSYVYSYMYL